MVARGKLAGLGVLATALVATGVVAGTYVKAAAFLLDLSGTHQLARHWLPAREYAVTVSDTLVPTRHGGVPARLYVSTRPSARSVVVVPGVHGGGLDQPRLAQFNTRLSASGVTVLSLPLPDLRAFQITARSTDMIEDAAVWVAQSPRLSPRGRVSLAGVSFAGGLALVAAGRPALRDRLDSVISIGGYGDLPRTLRYLCTGVASDGARRMPHDYAVAILTLTAAPLLVPSEQVPGFTHAVRTYLDASVDESPEQRAATALLASMRAEAAAMPEPSSGLLKSVDAHDVAQLGEAIAPFLDALGHDPALSPERSPATMAPVFLLHGSTDTIVPSSEASLLAGYLTRQGNVHVRWLVTPAVSHAGVEEGVGIGDFVDLIAFWREVLTDP